MEKIKKAKAVKSMDLCTACGTMIKWIVRPQPASFGSIEAYNAMLPFCDEECSKNYQSKSKK